MRTRPSRPLTLDFSNEEEVEALYQMAWDNPKRIFVIRPTDVGVARAWIRGHAFQLLPRPVGFPTQRNNPDPLRPGMVLTIVTLRKVCGWSLRLHDPRKENRRLCAHPADETSEVDKVTGLRLCNPFNCPLGFPAQREDIKNRDEPLWLSVFRDSHKTPEGWLVLTGKPRYASLPNVRVIGCEDVLTPQREVVEGGRIMLSRIAFTKAAQKSIERNGGSTYQGAAVETSAVTLPEGTETIPLTFHPPGKHVISQRGFLLPDGALLVKASGMLRLAKARDYEEGLPKDHPLRLRRGEKKQE